MSRENAEQGIRQQVASPVTRPDVSAGKDSVAMRRGVSNGGLATFRRADNAPRFVKSARGGVVLSLWLGGADEADVRIVANMQREIEFLQGKRSRRRR